MKCPNCQENNPNDAYFCHVCGSQIKNKTNSWMIASIILAVLTCLLLVSLLNTPNHEPQNQNDTIRIENSTSINTQSTSLQKDEQINQLQSQIRTQKSTIDKLNAEISRLRQNTNYNSHTEAEVLDLKRRIRELEQTIKEKNREIEALRGVI
jgi:predicted RNase H-like nuclease (RuvC/YqgF family)